MYVKDGLEETLSISFFDILYEYICSWWVHQVATSAGRACNFLHIVVDWGAPDNTPQ